MAQQLATQHFHTTSNTLPLWQRVIGLDALWRSRQVLGTLDARALEDIGISAAEAQQEATRAPWDVPAHWTRLG